jgi:cytochrome c biogenesis protein CcmG/thiol:disulfide interchange protein DsbE
VTNQPSTLNDPVPKPWGRILAWGGLILLLAIIGVALLKAQQGQFGVGQKAPNFEVTTFDGQQVSLENLRGKVVLLNFWASWCIPCEQEAAELEQAWQLYKGHSDVVFLGIAWSDMDPKAKAYIKKYGITYPNAPDMGTRASQAYRITGVPETYIIDRDGVLAYVKFSPFQSVEEISAALDAVLEK